MCLILTHSCVFFLCTNFGLMPLAKNIILKGDFFMSQMFEKFSDVTPLAWGIFAAIVVLSIIGLVFLSKKQESTTSTLLTKKLVYGGICIAISFVLSYIRLFKMPQGGSITPASMFPLVLYSMIFGPVSGVIAGIAYGFLQVIQDPSICHPVQLLLDYPLAFGCIGLAGLAPQSIKNLHIRTSLAICLAFIGRCTMHVISGVIFFAEFAPEGMNPIIYSIIYNGSFLLVELVITLVLAIIVCATPIYVTMKKGASPSYNI